MIGAATQARETAPETAPEPVDRQSAPTLPTSTVVALGLGLAGVLLLALVVGGARPVAPGLAQAGPLVDWGLPIVRLAARVAALGTVGALLFAAVLLPGQAGSLPVASRRALRAASRWALAWAGVTLLGGILTASELVGVPPTSLSVATLRTFVLDVPAGRAAVVVLGITGIVALAARRFTHPAAAAGLLVVALAGLVVPAVLTGHSAAAADHVFAVTTLSVHVVAASLWIGGLLALLLYGRRAEIRGTAATRFSGVALACFSATGISGVVAAWVVVGGAGSLLSVVGTGYGWLLIGKTAALIALGVFGWHHRRRSLPRLRAGQPRSFARFAAVEVAVMLAAVALAVALAASPPPAAGNEQAAASPAGTAPGQSAPAAQPASPADPMAGHDHGKLSVTVLIDETRFHVAGSVEAGSRVTVFNETATEVTITAEDGSFDLVVPGGTLTTFVAPEEPGGYAFSSRHSASYADVLVVD